LGTSLYVSEIERRFAEIYSVAKQARCKGIDPFSEPECAVTRDVAERVEKSVGPKGVAVRIRELTETMPREEVAFKIAEEIVLGKFGLGGEEAAKNAIRTALSILDEGRTVSSIQGISDIKTKTNPDRSKYLAVYFAGPIRSAGGTEMGLTLVISDYVRRLMGLDRYKATEDEARRFVEEVRLHERELTRFQFKLSDSELFNAVMRLPVEATGVETDPVEVVSFRNLPRIETNRVRGGALRVVNDGLVGRSKKVIKIVEKIGISGWDWLEDIRTVKVEDDEARNVSFMDDVIAGRPIFCFPNAEGGFRLRYGRSRNTGLAALGIHPVTMKVLRDFIATGTQLRVEKPGKAGVIGPVESIEPPIVKLKDGSVVRVESVQQATELRNSIQSILFLGDLLVAFGEFLENNRPLLPSGFVEEWWAKLVERELSRGDRDSVLSQAGLSYERIRRMVDAPLIETPSECEALSISRALNVPLHPRWTYFWETLRFEDLDYLRNSFSCAQRETADEESVTVLPNDPKLKGILESLRVPHVVRDGSIEIAEGHSLVLRNCLGISDLNIPLNPQLSVLENISRISGLTVYKKVGAYIGARMGRPEKAKKREMSPPVHCLFPVAMHGGSRRNIVEAVKGNSSLTIEIIKRRCPSCKTVTHQTVCAKCKCQTVIEYVCPKCGRSLSTEKCPSCKIDGVSYETRSVDVRTDFESACKTLGVDQRPDLVKGVKGLTSVSRTPEPIEKGILRAKFGLSTFKDGTIRFDATDAPLTHFNSNEVGVKIEKLRELGYHLDYKQRELVDGDQLCELQLQDIVIPEGCADYLVNVAKFTDELLQKLYGLSPYYRAKTKEDLVGHLIFGMSPHTSVGVVGRVVGFTKASVCFANPLWHAAKRRDCDGDEDAVMLALDVLLNFSRSYLPGRIGGLMDAPLLLTVTLNPAEVARQAFNMEVVESFPLEFFEQTLREADPKIVQEMIETVSRKLENGSAVTGFGFTHFVGNLNNGNQESVYKRLGTMLEKVEEQLGLAEAIVAVKAKDVASRVLSTHLMRDVTGNLKAFSTQKMRCVKCNFKYRRIPLKGVCPRCGGKLVLTVHRGTIEKYIEIARDLVKRYDLGKYHEQRLMLLEDEIESLFMGEDKTKQKALGEFM
jgi:DNA polymerase II large subunit